MATLTALMIIIVVSVGGENEFKARLNLLQASAHPFCPRDGTVPASIGKRHPAPMFSLFFTRWKYDCTHGRLRESPRVSYLQILRVYFDLNVLSEA